ncbi:hypothetical protein N7495_005621 [Penicillium taxi]|uniref:uncharacterized protein n=1 Tax=Penicillium taxi TaxID=168475 RepID=UPI002545A9D2|nr:uncharacterized protein N7495_005621 [Penicillium taxi]KAJ5893930.1 hypothetical protein N7495_005621 [Penicillium taxi]
MATLLGKRTVSYGLYHSLQKICVTTLEPRPGGYWLIYMTKNGQFTSYIHGGAWRDPTVTSAAFDAAESILTSNSPSLPISGYASISYRLSAHPNHPQDETSTPPEDFRSAKHPDHIRDVEAALAFLQNTYGFGARYILVGHSCGATLAFQAVMGAVAGHREQSFIGGAMDTGAGAKMVSTSSGPLPPRLSAHPTAIVGVAGIYDLRRLVDTHRDISAYREFVEGAFGVDQMLWDTVSPAQMMGSRGVEGGWKSGRLVILAHSKEDGLVDEGQMDAMRTALKGWESTKADFVSQDLPGRDRRVRELEISDKHDNHWVIGEGLARAIKYAFLELQNMGLAPEPEELSGSTTTLI